MCSSDREHDTRTHFIVSHPEIAAFLYKSVGHDRFYPLHCNKAVLSGHVSVKQFIFKCTSIVYAPTA